MNRTRRVRTVLLFLILGAALGVLAFELRNSGLYAGHPTQLPPGFHEELIATELDRPSSLAIAPDGRVFIVMEDGSIRIVENDVLLPQPFVTLDTLMDVGGAMFHVAFDPDFETNHWVYVYYFAPGNKNRLARLTADGNRAVPDSFVTIWDSDPEFTSDHHGGSPVFDENNLIYFGTGDSDAGLEARNLSSLNGKVIRITRDGKPAPGNPFLNVPNARPEIYASGFRNAYNLARDSVTGTILVNDVGEGAAEEINTLVPGRDYGYPMCEGKCDPPNPQIQDPLRAYPHTLTNDGGCAIVGGVFYQPAHPQFPPQFLNKYFYADLCSGWIRTLDLSSNTSTLFATALIHPIDVKVANDGSLYYLVRGIAPNFFESRYPGQLWRVQYAPPKTQP